MKNRHYGNYKIPEYFQYLNWYDLDTPTGIYSFIREMQDNGINIEDYPEIKVYYDVLYNNAFKDEPNIISVDYVVKKLKNALKRYGFAHTTTRFPNELYYFWYEH